MIDHLTVSLGDLPSPIIVKQTESTGSSAYVPNFPFPGRLHQCCPQLHPGAAEKERTLMIPFEKVEVRAMAQQQ